MKVRTRKRKPVYNRRANPLRTDPTRTLMLRKALATELRKRFARLKLKLHTLIVTEDAFGLVERKPPAFNEFNPDQPRDETGKFAAIGAAISGAEHAVVSVVGAGFAKLPAPVQKVVSATIKTAFAVWTAGQAMAERVAKERGATPEQAAKIRATLATADLVAFKAAKVGAFSGVPGAGMATAISGSIPVASAGYLAYSTATNPLATYRAAKGLVRDAVSKLRGTKKSEQRPAFKPSVTQIGNASPDVDTLANALAAHDYTDWYTALLCAALDETGNATEAVQVADVVYAQNPETTVNAWITTEHGQHVYLDDATGEVQPSGPKGDKSGGTLKDADVLSKVKSLGAKQSGLVKLEDLGRDLGTTPAELHKTLEKLWRERKVTMSAAEGRGGLSAEAQRWQMAEPGSGGSAAKLGHVELRNNAALIANENWRFQSAPDKIKAFKEWLATQVEADVLGEDDLWQRYAMEGFRKGAGRAFDDVQSKRFGPKAGDFYEGSRREFLRSAFGRPVAVEKVKLLAGRAYDDLAGVTQAMSTKIVRSLTDGLVRGQSPREIARQMAKDVEGIGQRRALLISHDAIIRTHAEGQLTALEELGVEEVGVSVEWSTTGDEHVCFPAWTMVETEQGPLPIQSVRVGTMVQTRVGFRRVKAVSDRAYSGRMTTIRAGAHTLTCTSRHPIWVQKNGWVDAKDVIAGNDLRTFEGQTVEVSRVEHFRVGGAPGVAAEATQRTGRPGTSLRVRRAASGLSLRVYDLQVEDRPEFFANGILVHNCELCEPLEGVTLKLDEARGMLPRHVL